jgi:hypothetical protein
MGTERIIDGTSYYNINPSSERRGYKRDTPALAYMVHTMEEDARKNIDPDATVGLDITTERAENGIDYALNVRVVVLVRREKLYGKESTWLRPSGIPSINGFFPKELPFEMCHIVGPDYINEVFRFSWPHNPFLHHYSKGPWVACLPWVRYGEWDSSSFSMGMCKVDTANEVFRLEGKSPIPIPDRLIDGYQVLEELTQRVSDLLFEGFGPLAAGRILNSPGDEYNWRMTYSPNRPLISQFPEDLAYWMDAVQFLVEKLWNQIRRQTRYYYSRSTYLKDPYYPTTDGPEIAINILDDYEDEEEP